MNDIKKNITTIGGRHGPGAKSAPSSRERIRDAYSQDSQKYKVEYIPPKEELIKEEEMPKLRVCAYCRVTTDEEAQQSSYELQVQHYRQYIHENPRWEFVDIYADEGITSAPGRL